MDISQIEARLNVFVENNYPPGTAVEKFRVMEAGHAGLTYGFSLSNAQGSTIDNLIMKLAPPGVKRKGSTDIFRQAALLRALNAAGVKAPDIRWAGEDEHDFGTPYIMMERVSGREFYLWSPDEVHDLTPEFIEQIWRELIEIIASLHQMDWQVCLPDWEQPRALSSELSFWNRFVEKAPESDWAIRGKRAFDLLMKHLPTDGPVGLVHGDCTPNNTLYSSGKATALIDWDLASVGDQLTDLGWIMSMLDPVCYNLNPHKGYGMSPGEAAQLYQTLMGRSFENLAWYHAFGCFKSGAITCINVNLHRSGKRRDAMWERSATATASKFHRCVTLLADL